MRYGRFRVVTKADGRPVFLGSGSCAITYEAVETGSGDVVALKVIHEDLARDPEIKQRFLNESRAIAALRHPYIAKLLECGEAEGTLYYAMEYCDGGDLEKLVTSRGPLPEETVLQFGRQAARALAYVHEQGYLHRDLKPSNLMLSMVPGRDEANLKVIDFGLVKSLGHASTLTQPGQFRGTVQYSSPEQLRDEPVDERSDIYSLGMTLWFLLKGSPPLKDSSIMVADERLAGGGPAARLPKTVHPAVRALLTEMLQPDPGRRVRNMNIVLAGIEECKVQLKRPRPAVARAAVPAAAAQPAPEAQAPQIPSYAQPQLEPPRITPPRPIPATVKPPSSLPEIGTIDGPIPEATMPGRRPPPSTVPLDPAPKEPPPVRPPPAKPSAGLRTINVPLAKKFELLEEHEDAHGDLGTSYLARRLSTGDVVQVTKIQRRLASDTAIVRQLETMALQASRCEGVFIIRPLSFIKFQDHLVLLEEKLEGLPLLMLLRSRRLLSMPEAAILLRQLAEACDLAIKGGVGSLDLSVHRLTFQFPHMFGAPLSEREAQRLLSRSPTQWPPFLIRVLPDYGEAHRSRPAASGGRSGASTVTIVLNEETDLPARYAGLTYHILSGQPVPEAAKMSRTGYVAIPGLGEEGNRFLARVIAKDHVLPSCTHFITTLYQIENLPVPPLNLP